MRSFLIAVSLFAITVLSATAQAEISTPTCAQYRVAQENYFLSEISQYVPATQMESIKVFVNNVTYGRYGNINGGISIVATKNSLVAHVNINDRPAVIMVGRACP
tara:strand:+ start:129784 stop:130098 length:315 start_codon:yes stop_codon:yes gene_type:complete